MICFQDSGSFKILQMVKAVSRKKSFSLLFLHRLLAFNQNVECLLHSSNLLYQGFNSKQGFKSFFQAFHFIFVFLVFDL